MNKQKFIEYLRTPADLNEQTLDELEQLIAEHPYFQSARTLLAKGSKMNKSPKTAKRLNSAAIYATDRALLKRYINDELIFLKPLQVHESHEADHERDLGKVIKTNRQTTTKQKIDEVSRIKKPEETAVKNQTKEQTPAPEAPANSELDHIIDELYKDMEELKSNRAKFKEWETKLEEDEAVSEAVKKATSKAGKSEQVAEEVAKKIKETDQKKPEETKAPTENIETKSEVEESKEEQPSAPNEAENSFKEENPSEKETQKKPSESQSVRKTKASPKSPKTKKKPTSKKPTKASSKKEETAAAKKKVEKIPKVIEETPETQEDSPPTSKRKSDQESIIADFIKKNPSISPADGSTKTDMDLSGDSTLLHPDLASEYLAEIYLEQGKKDTARKIYENLMVKFPEKKVYFAKIIKELN